MTNPVLEAYLFGHVIDPGDAIEMIDLSEVPEEWRNDDSSSFHESDSSKKVSKRKRRLLAEKRKRKQAKIERRNRSASLAHTESEEVEINFDYGIRATPGKVHEPIRSTSPRSNGCLDVLIP